MRETTCAQSDAIAALLGEGNDRERRQRALLHVAECPSCRATYLAAKDGQARSARRGTIAWLMAAVVAAGALAIWWNARTAKPISGLVSAVSGVDHRPVEARLFGGFRYRPYAAPQRASNEDLAAAVEAAQGDPRATAIGDLLTGRLDRSIEQFESLLESGERADLLTDLAAARYERARRDDHSLDLPFAFTAAARACELAPGAPEPRHVYALIVEALGLREDALEAWNAYLAIDSTSKWADEARERVARLAPARPVSSDEILRIAAMADERQIDRIAEQAPQLVREIVEDQLFADWAVAYEAGNTSRAATLLKSARLFGEALVRRGGDRTLLDCARAIEGGSSDDVARLAKAHRLYQRGRELYGESAYAEARPALLEAGSLLRDTKSSLAWRAFMYAAASSQRLGDESTAWAELQALLQALRQHADAYPAVYGQALWARGRIEFARGRGHDSLATYVEAQKWLVRARENSNVVGVTNMIAASYRQIGDAESAWTHTLITLRTIDELTTYSGRQGALSDASYAAARSEHAALADLFARRFAINVRLKKDPGLFTQALHLRGVAMLARRNYREADRLLTLAETSLDEKTSRANPQMRGFITSARGEALVNIDPEAAAHFLEAAIASSRADNYEVRMPRMQLELGKAYRRMERLEDAEEAFRQGLAFVEEQRASLPKDEDRSMFTDTARSLYEELIGRLVARGATDEALNVVRSARVIGVTSPVSMVADTDRRETALADDGTRIEYFILPDALLIWSTAGRRNFVRQPLPEHFSDRIDRGTAALRSCRHMSDCKGEAAALYDLLIRPVGEEIRGSDELTIAPDAVLHRVPFGALYDSNANEFLVERHTITIALGDGGSPAHRPYRSILVAAPRTVDPTLPNLAHARAEARRAAAAFPVSEVLDEDSATAERFLARAGEHEIVHFAGHARWNERQPGSASLLFTPVGNPPVAALYADDVSKHRFNKTRLVVLAACDTARGKVSSVGLLGFARTFTAAGVPHVIGSLWPVDDRASAQLFSHFYPAVARGAEPARALRDAQRALLAASETNGPAHWATFQIYSGNEQRERGKQ
jgi:CHAT domain-containing protein